MPHLSALSLALNRPGAVSLEQVVASLFAAGEQGAWYDPSDYSTMFQVSTGATPVTAVEQPVGLILDRRKGLVLGPELVTGAASAYPNSTIATVGDTVTATCSTNGTYGIRWATGAVATAGWVKMTVEIVTNGAARSVVLFPNLINAGVNVGTTVGNKVCHTLVAATSGSNADTAILIQGGVAGETFSVRLASVKYLDGNHAYQTGSTARPVLRARYNLLEYSEQFDNAYWTRAALNAFGSGSVVNTTATTDPIGGNTAEFIQEDTALTTTHGINRSVTITANATYTLTCHFKAATRSIAILGMDSAGGNGARSYFNLSSTGSVGTNAALGTGTLVSTPTITSLGNGWFRCQITAKVDPAATTAVLRFSMSTADNTPTYTGNGTSGLYIWGADLRVGTSAGDYQRIAAATDYATTSTITGQPFRPYLEQPTGGDDSLIVANSSFNDFAASDAPFFMSAGVTRYGTTRGTIFCLADNTNATAGNNDTLNLEADSTAQVRGYLLDYDAGGNTEASATAGTLAAEATFIASWQRTATDGFARNNGTAGTGVDQTAPAVALPLATVFAQRRGTSPTTDQRFTGRMFGLIVRAGTISAGQMSAVETYLAGKSGVTL